jgi:hypothetical protein
MVCIISGYQRYVVCQGTRKIVETLRLQEEPHFVHVNPGLEVVMALGEGLALDEGRRRRRRMMMMMMMMMMMLMMMMMMMPNMMKMKMNDCTVSDDA